MNTLIYKFLEVVAVIFGVIVGCLLGIVFLHYIGISFWGI
jgi:hypothetical protein